MPVVLRQYWFGAAVTSPNQFNTAAGGTLALVLGYLGYRRLHVFPGITAGGYIVASVSFTFAMLATMLVVLRLDYSRVQFAISYVLTSVIFTLIHLIVRRRRRVCFGVIPGGRTNRLPQLGSVTWHHIETPDAPTPPLHGVVVDLSADHSAAWDSRITSFVLQGAPVYHVKQAIEQLTGRVEVDHLSENTLGSLNPNDVFFKIKATVDILAALCMLIVLSPAMLLIAVLIRLDSPGPALFRQCRTGFRARPFTIYKFRTMRIATAASSDEEARRRAMTQANDPRITRLGAFLRKSRLDELPQLINIVRGEMSLIGPRPEAAELTSWYEKEIPFYHYRHIIKPGVTGWAQINQGHVSEVEAIKEKLNLDFYYVKNFSLWLDILIILRTVHTMFTGTGAR
ncbi:MULTISPECIES: sugar transferase [Sphingomonas]|uniref:Exopolysaccharide biosynthesis polyprenyl glycosylphosphotransferase n=1 Tax=Sphingomonas kyeonggiensis TaxID=1268553 RepID=A0A7W7NSB4_9SPHN|nr:MULTISPECIES: sugar transferase [Sphingomonas]MBB4839778.1 exopolysaccharide biosynthesis polyprenyl glycosylphosphotransferase [Sphingomonas kyeonggiensis]WHU03012.1 sugar transferase [Sphingomonas sp. NIBR02145]